MDNRSKHPTPSSLPGISRRQSYPLAIGLSWACPYSMFIRSAGIHLPSSLNFSSQSIVAPTKPTITKSKEAVPTHMQHKNTKPRLRATSHALPRSLDIFLQLPHRVLQSRSGIVHFVYDEDVFAHQIRHFERGQIKPLRAGHLGAWRFDRLRGVARGEGFVEGEANGLDRDVGCGGPFEEGAGRRWRLAANKKVGRTQSYRSMRAGT